MTREEAESVIDQTYLKERLHYNPDTGVFTWRKSGLMTKSWNVRHAGKRAGTLVRASNLYVCRKLKLMDVIIAEHHLAHLYMEGEWPPRDKVIDHINRDATDNRWSNIRVVAPEVNAKNLSMNSRNTSGVTGVSWVADEKKWRARPIANGKSYSLGSYRDKEKAAEVVREFRKKHGFTEGSGEKKRDVAPKRGLTLRSNSTSGWRYISFDATSGKWAVKFRNEGAVSHKQFDTLCIAKAHLKSLLEETPSHKYHTIAHELNSEEENSDDTV